MWMHVNLKERAWSRTGRNSRDSRGSATELYQMEVQGDDGTR